LAILITSNITRRSAHDIIVTSAHPEFIQTGLVKDSAIRVSKMTTLEKSAIRGQLGKLGSQLSIQVERELRAFLELPPFQPQLTPAVPGA
jgi:hypothetical protein